MKNKKGKIFAAVMCGFSGWGCLYAGMVMVGVSTILVKEAIKEEK